MSPPPHPLLCSALLQSTNCCSLSDMSFPLAMALLPSVEPVVENAQHDPHCPWFFTGVTAFWDLQSTESSAVLLSFFTRRGRVRLYGWDMNLKNSSPVRSAHSFKPRVKE